ncbi:uncharacterized protein LOC124362040 [Homalodisca vitripennis]|uniref:uncharacterized protein LOC124362040 n=1 Tax=Homalodisca vitripennis TaxID=197043 RepID=UPI001EEA8712|nr:uncharacterized protein LOC124362040 [Homalodisca vitripennis]XP_046672152.1 uncharacterized protein LOC124362040 [Homalodisca vitripennis]
MAEECPAWLDATFLASALQGEDGSHVTIDKFSVSPAVAAGNNYMSHLFRVSVEYSVAGSDIQVNSFIVKVPISKGVITKHLDKADFYAKEPRIYKELLPKFSKIINYEFGPRLFRCPLKNGMVLKDLLEEGYVLCDKFKQLDFAHCKIVYTTLAKFHAASVACNHDDPELTKQLGINMRYTSRNVMYLPFTKSALKYFKNALGEMEGCELATELVLSRADLVAESITDFCKPKANGLNVLNHGDVWINNLLFKKLNSGEVVDVKFIDFQVSRWGSPVQDLLFFLWTSANEEVREYRQKELFTLYRHTLNSSLEQLGCLERLSEQEMEDDLRAAVDFVLLTISGTLPFVRSGSDGAVTIGDLSAEQIKSFDVLKHLYSNKRFREVLPKIVQQFQKWIVSLVL